MLRDSQVPSEAYPLVSIVTPSYNQARFLEETMRSVLDQDYPNVEYILIDGGSTDGSVEVIRKYEDRLAYWISERDRGQSHAINKGWERATGDIIAYLNSDDLYTPGAITRAVGALTSDRTAGMVYGDALWIDEHGDVKRPMRGRPFDIRTFITSEGFVPQPTVFMWRHALDAVGLLDENLHMAMDYDLWVRLGLRYPAIYLQGDCLAKAREHSSAKSTAQIEKFVPERRRILDKVFRRDDLPPSVRNLRGQAYAAVSFYQAALAAYAGKPREIVPPLLRAAVESPAYMLRRPVHLGCLLARSAMPWWTGRPSPLLVKAWRALNGAL